MFDYVLEYMLTLACLDKMQNISTLMCKKFEILKVIQAFHTTHSSVYQGLELQCLLKVKKDLS